MTVNTEIARIAHDGDGASQTFAVQFYFLQDADLTVYVGGAKQTLTTNYTVAGAGNPSGGGVTFVVAPPAGSGNVVIIRDPDQLQSTRYPANDPFPAKTHETALDKLTMLVQRTRDLINRAFVFNDADTSAASLLVPSPQGGFLIGWKADGSGLENYANIGDGSGLSVPVSTTNGGTGSAFATFGALVAAIKAALGLGTASAVNTGTATGNVSVLDANALLPQSTIKHPVTGRAANTTLVAADNNGIFAATGIFTQTFDAAATLGNGWQVTIRNDGAGVITLDPTETIDGKTSLNLYPGESCNVTSNGVLFKTSGLGTGLVYVSKQTISSAVATVDVIGIDSTFDEWVIKFYEVVPATNDIFLLGRVSEDNGATFKSAAASYSWSSIINQNGTVTGAGSASDTSMRLSHQASNVTTDGGMNGQVTLYRPGDTTHSKVIQTEVNNLRLASGADASKAIGIYIGSVNAINAFRFLETSGNISSGTFVLYGVRKP
ncbi:MAG: hypothetical protein JWN73_4345 [Betaproteobacteria bacterium]|nr:hypothetical protein [Betaproteobacteria bacterium]